MIPDSHLHPHPSFPAIFGALKKNLEVQKGRHEKEEIGKKGSLLPKVLMLYSQLGGLWFQESIIRWGRGELWLWSQLDLAEFQPLSAPLNSMCCSTSVSLIFHI